MPILRNAKTVWVNDDAWESPDGKVTIWQIKLEVDGERDTHNTMSKALATVGFEGDVEVYTNAKGKDYVRQAPKEDGQPHSSGETSFKADPVKQDNIHRSVALEQAVRACKAMTSDTNKAPMNKETVLEVADAFYTWLKNEKPSTEAPEQSKAKVDKVFFPDEPPADYVSNDEQRALDMMDDDIGDK